MRIAVSLLVIVATFFVVSCGEGDSSSPPSTRESSTATSNPNQPPAPTPNPQSTLASTPAPQPTTALPPVATPEPTSNPQPTPVPTTSEPTPSSAQENDREVLLERTSETLANAFAKREWLLMYGLYPDQFRANCSPADFAGLMTFAWAFLGVPEDVTANIEDVRSEGNQAWVDFHFEKDGVRIDLGEESEDDVPTLTWEDGRWVVYVSPEDLAQDDPCNLEFGSETESTPASTPAVQPTAISTAPPTTISPPPEPVYISGSGTTVETISLVSEGIWIASIDVSGNEDCSFGTCIEDNFIVSIESVDGSSFEFPVNEIAKDWSGGVTVAVGGLFGLSPGTQVVSVEASGDWTIAFSLALPQAPPDDPEAPVSITGSGTAVQTIPLFSEGVWIVSLNVSDNEECSLGSCWDDNFIVTIESVDGSNFEFPANEITSDWSAEVTVTVGSLFGLPAGTQVVSIESSGDWIITFTKA